MGIMFLKIIHLILCVLVVSLVLLLNQKSEGLSGIMGGSSYSSRGAKGMDEGMRRMVTYLGMAWIGSSILLDIFG